VENQDIAAHAVTSTDIRNIAASGRLAVLWGFQNTAPIEHDIELVGTFKQLGVTVMQLTYNLQNYIGSGYWEETDSGLSSRFGRLVVDEMNQVGVLIDLSHCGDRTSRDAIAASAAPVAMTHTNPREYVGAPPFGAGRLAETAALKEMASRGGVVGLSPLKSLSRASDLDIDQFVDMVAWTVDLLGAESVGIGSDYCPGFPSDIVNWWRYGRWSRESVPPSNKAEEDDFPDWFTQGHWGDSLGARLLDRGFSSGAVDGILGKNWLSLLDRVAEAANR
jgi:microsomal dipeptidase-like Zn-dependent dipeptidase